MKKLVGLVLLFIVAGNFVSLAMQNCLSIPLQKDNQVEKYDPMIEALLNNSKLMGRLLINAAKKDDKEFVDLILKSIKIVNLDNALKKLIKAAN